MRPASSWALGIAGLIMIVLETVRAGHAIVHARELGGLSFVGLALPPDLVAAGGPVAATIGLFGLGLSWNGKRAGHAIVLALSAAFVVTHILDQVGIPGPRVAEIGRFSGLFPAWVTLFWAWASVVTATLSARALLRQSRA